MPGSHNSAGQKKLTPPKFCQPFIVEAMASMQASRPPPSQRLNPLATAKGQKLLCELTGKPASIASDYQLLSTRVLFSLSVRAGKHHKASAESSWAVGPCVP